MIKRIPAESRHFSNAGWLQTYWLFSFSDYYDPSNTHHGALRVFNDDIVAPQSGFPEHPHSNFEIITIVVSGELTHQDTTGSRGVLKSGDVQHMSAGSGIFHSEFNYGMEPVHLYQIWIRPREDDLSPSYEQCHFDLGIKNQLVKLVSSEGKEGLIMKSDSSLYHGLFDPVRNLTYAPSWDRRSFVYMTKGEMSINNKIFSAGDQARIEGEPILEIQSVTESEFILIDVPAF